MWSRPPLQQQQIQTQLLLERDAHLLHSLITGSELLVEALPEKVRFPSYCLSCTLPKLTHSPLALPPHSSSCAPSTAPTPPSWLLACPLTSSRATMSSHRQAWCRLASSSRCVHLLEPKQDCVVCRKQPLCSCCPCFFLQHMLATFRSTRVSSMSCELNEQSASLKVTLRCDNGEHPVSDHQQQQQQGSPPPQDCCMSACVWLWLISSLSGWLAGWVVGCRPVEALWSGHQQHRHPAGQPGRLRAAGVSGGRGVRAQQVSRADLSSADLLTLQLVAAVCAACILSIAVSAPGPVALSGSGPVAAVCAASILHVLYHMQQAQFCCKYTVQPHGHSLTATQTQDTHTHTQRVTSLTCCVPVCVHNHTAPTPALQAAQHLPVHVGRGVHHCPASTTGHSRHRRRPSSSSTALCQAAELLRPSKG